MSEWLRRVESLGFGRGPREDFLAGVGALWETVLLAAVVAVLLFLLTLVFTKHMGWRKKRAFVFGMLYGMTDRERLWLSGQIVRQICIVSTVCFGVRPGVPHMILFAGLFLIEAAAPPFAGPGRLCFSFANNAVVFGALFVGAMLYGFLRDVRGDARILLIYVLMGLFVSLYALYFTLRDLSVLIEGRNRFDDGAREGGA
jgi:hypothetical protein